MLHSFPNETFYKNTLNENIINKANDFIETIADKFNHRTWDCDIKTSYNLTENILNFPELHSLKMNVLGHIDNFMRMRNNKFFNGFIDNSWVNIYEKNFYQEPHVHTSAIHRFICGVLYLSHNNSPIVFRSQFKPLSDYQIVPEFSEIILFNDDLPHSVSKNENEGRRVSLAFNFRLCEEHFEKK